MMRIARIVDENGVEMYVQEKEAGAYFRLEGDLFAGPMQESDQPVSPASFLPPVTPRVIFCIGLNYKEHIEEGGAKAPEFPVMFMKNPVAAIGHQQAIEIPAICSDEVDFEAELAVVIKKAAKNVSKAEAMDYVLGFTIANDVSARSWQLEKGGSQWNRGKGFDTFAPLGPVLVTPDELPNPSGLAISCRLNGEEVQASTTDKMIFDIPTLIEFLSQGTTLLPGTVILTGTPQGVGWARTPRKLMHAGDTVEVAIEKIGVLSNPIR